MTAYRFVIPLALGAAAAAANYYAVTARMKTVAVVVVTQDVRPGETLTADVLRPEEVRMENPALLNAAIRFEGMALLTDKQVNRPIRAGELLLKTDVEKNPSFVNTDLKRSDEDVVSVLVRRSVIGGYLVPGQEVALQYAPSAGRNGGPADADREVVLATRPYRFLGTEPVRNAKEDVVKAVFAVPRGDRALAAVAVQSDETGGHLVVRAVILVGRGE